MNGVSKTQVDRSDGPENLVLSVRQRWGVNRKTLSRLTGYSERALAGWEAGESMTEPARRSMIEALRLAERLAPFWNSPEKLARWLEQPNSELDGLKPLEVIERGQTDRLWDMVFELERGNKT
jgi:hypothetical protein